MSEAVGSNGGRATMYPDTDNATALQSLLNANTVVTIPPGRWLISQTLNLKLASQVICSYGQEAASLVQYGSFAGPVIGIGGSGRWTGGGPAANGCVIRDISVIQTVNSDVNNKCIWIEGGDGCLVDRVRVSGSSYEGIVAGSGVDGLTVRNFEAADCGNGGPAYPLSTAGINCTPRNLLVEDFITIRCGQGIEGGNSPGGIFRRGTVVGPGSGTPPLGVNIGSTGRGIYRTTVEDVFIRGYITSMSIGPNGIGKFCGVTVQRCDMDGGLSFSGGQTINAVPGQPGEGPDTEGSYLLDNTVRISGLSNNSILYNTGPSPAYEVYGREPLTILGNTIIYDGTAQTTPSIGFAGKIVPQCIVYNNKLVGLNNAPSRGDIAAFTSGSNASVPGMYNLIYGRNTAYKANGSERSLSIKIEGRP